MKHGHTALELLLTLGVAGLLASLVVTRVADRHEVGDATVCQLQATEIEVAVETWRHETGAWPAADLSDIGADLNFFPQGTPVCPVDGTSYTIDATGRVIGHAH